MSKIQRRQFYHAMQQALQQYLPFGYRCESVFTAEDLSYTVQVSFVDLQNVVPGVRCSYSESDALIKYSEVKYSPVSAEFLKLATPRYYQEHKGGGNSELIADDLESAVKETLDWRSQGSIAMEAIKKRMIEFSPCLINNLKAEITWARDNFCMYCTSIDPSLSCKREKQMKDLSTCYDFMSKIEKPTEFAMQLGCDVGKHISLHNDLKRDYSEPPIYHILGSFYRQQSGFMGEYLICVDHGPIIYLDEDKIEEIVREDSQVKGPGVIPFVKRERYKDQQEYRFIVSIQGHILDKKEFYLEISADLRNLVSPM